MNTEFKNILKPLFKWEAIGRKETSSGAILIGHVPHIAPEAWLNIIFSPLDDKGIDCIKKRFRQQNLPEAIPETYRNFLETTNGLSIFSGSLVLYGYRTSYERSGDDVWHPFDLNDHSAEHLRVHQHSKTIPDSHRFFIGSYRWDGSGIYIDTVNGSVCFVKRGSDEAIHSWTDFPTFLTQEIERLSKLFDDKGRKYEKKQPTIPI